MFTITYENGSYADFKALSRFHYCSKRPRVVANIIRAVGVGSTGRRELAGVVVISWPVPFCAERNRIFGIGSGGKGGNLRFVNKNIKVISRVIVHPRFRALGIGTELVRRAMRMIDTPYVEAMAHLGRAVPLFEKAGMTRAPSLGEDRPAYFWSRTQK